MAACTTSPSSLVRPGDVAKILRQYSSLNNEANASLSVRAQGRDEAGSAAAIDDETFRLDKSIGYKTVDGATYQPFSLVALSSSVPDQHEYPLVIGALTRPVLSKTSSKTNSAPRNCGVGLVLVKESPRASWKVVEEPDVQLSAIPAFRYGKDHYGIVAKSKGLAVSLQSLPTVVASAWQTELSGGSPTDLPSTLFSPSPSSCFILPSYNASLSSGGSVQQSGHVVVDHRYGEEAFALRRGALVFFTLEESKVITELDPASWLEYRWTPASSAEFYGTKKGSKYSAEQEVRTVELAVIDEPAGSKVPFAVVGEDGIMTSFSGTPWMAPPSTAAPQASGGSPGNSYTPAPAYTPPPTTPPTTSPPAPPSTTPPAAAGCPPGAVCIGAQGM